MPPLSRSTAATVAVLAVLLLAPPFVVDAAHRESAPACVPESTRTTTTVERAQGDGFTVIEERTVERTTGCGTPEAARLVASRAAFGAAEGTHVLEVTWRANGTREILVLDARGLAGDPRTGFFATYPEAELSASTHRRLPLI